MKDTILKYGSYLEENSFTVDLGGKEKKRGTFLIKTAEQIHILTLIKFYFFWNIFKSNFPFSLSFVTTASNKQEN